MLALSAFVIMLQSATAMVDIPAGGYRPLYGHANDAMTRVAAFRLDRDPVTRGAYLDFVRVHPSWRRSAVRALFARRPGYLQDWRGDLDAGGGDELARPVSDVSWFAARAYCAFRGARLPLMAEWEYVAAADSVQRNAVRDGRFTQHLVTLYATREAPRSLARDADMNAFGVRGLHGIGWEWVDDFNSVLVSNDSRGIGGRDHDVFCASGAIGAVDPSNYPAFLRHALRAGLTGRSTLETLGFRCAA